MSAAMDKLWTLTDLASRYGLEVKTVRDTVVKRDGFPQPIMPTGSTRGRCWKPDEVMRWEVMQGRRAA